MGEGSVHCEERLGGILRHYYRAAAQDALRDQNTVAGVLTWVYVAGFLLALIAAA